MEITTAEQNKEKGMKRIEDSLRDFWDNIKCTNIHIIGVPEEEERKKGTEKIFEEIIVENFPNMGKEIVNQVSCGFYSDIFNVKKHTGGPVVKNPPSNAGGCGFDPWSGN